MCGAFLFNPLMNYRMAKDAYYFSHDYDPLGDPKMQAMVAEYGGLGYGIFWRIVEMLHSDSNHKLPLKTYVYSAVATQMKSDALFVERFILDCLNKFELFIEANEAPLQANEAQSKQTYFASNRVLANIENKQEKKREKSDAGKLGGIKSGESRRNKKAIEANEAPLQANERNEAKESKVKESNTESLSIITSTTSPPEIGSEAVSQAANKAWDDQKWRENICLSNYFDLEHLKRWMGMYNASLIGNTELKGFSPSKYKQMFNGWLQSKISNGYKLPDKPISSNGVTHLKTIN